MNPAPDIDDLGEFCCLTALHATNLIELKWTLASAVCMAVELNHPGRIIANDVGDESTYAVTLQGARNGGQ